MTLLPLFSTIAVVERSRCCLSVWDRLSTLMSGNWGFSELTWEHSTCCKKLCSSHALMLSCYVGLKSNHAYFGNHKSHLVSCFPLFILLQFWNLGQIIGISGAAVVTQCFLSLGRDSEFWPADVSRITERKRDRFCESSIKRTSRCQY